MWVTLLGLCLIQASCADHKCYEILCIEGANLAVVSIAAADLEGAHLTVCFNDVCNEGVLSAATLDQRIDGSLVVDASFDPTSSQLTVYLATGSLEKHDGDLYTAHLLDRAGVVRADHMYTAAYEPIRASCHACTQPDLTELGQAMITRAR